VTAQPVGGG